MGNPTSTSLRNLLTLTNKKTGEFYTPRLVVRLMVNILAPKEGESIYDPVCGTGGILLEAAHLVHVTDGDDRTLWGKVFGQEKNLASQYKLVYKVHLTIRLRSVLHVRFPGCAPSLSMFPLSSLFLVHNAGL